MVESIGDTLEEQSLDGQNALLYTQENFVT